MGLGKKYRSARGYVLIPFVRICVCACGVRMCLRVFVCAYVVCVCCVCCACALFSRVVFLLPFLSIDITKRVRLFESDVLQWNAHSVANDKKAIPRASSSNSEM